ncbi:MULTISPECIES: efflux RND transporter periplasmic adaptor subunit [Thalassolituus]|jgi:HlyD family secretion protein|uniref:Probable Co/Zn/Cd efflux system membrane fusion protein n=1 Tax=hydrothermal vent metagenome TaxID=652676 RepID=A0A161K033_9ZZZZ|nr:efflux RND transporter periplasmic adaptor subunit [Thalassolituus oleivorans]MBQ0781207.1 efflux RND transporter periplasmic adaptor subunit [Thalassolituus oleivorans]MCA6128992.1 RND transporter [Thalassolituus oleivorans 4BN06-13]MDF1641481.1 efflux RND transporter periplasmic adaptor subunit [Thalassolituus oleivorans]
MKSALIIGGTVVAIIAAISLWPETPVAVTTTPVQVGKVESLVSNTRSGTVQACLRSHLSLTQGGQVNQLLVQQGDTVVAGQLLMTLWNDDIKAGIAQAQAQVAIAQSNKASRCRQAEADLRDAKRLRDLRKKNMASEEQLDRSNTVADISRFACEQQDAQIQQVQAALDLQQARLAQTELRAPFAGIIAEVNGEVGEYATPSPPGVATPPAIDLINQECLYVRAPIDEVDAAQVKIGMETRVTLDAFQDQTFTGLVSRIAPYVQDLEKQARTVDVDVTLSSLPQGIDLLIGYSADIEVITASRDNVVRIPTELLLEGNKVLTVQNDAIAEVPLTLGLTNWTWSEVTAGLKAGDAVINSLDIPDLNPGIKVKITPASDSGITKDD